MAGESYGIIDVQPFAADIVTNEKYNWCSYGFTFSISFKTDLHPYNDRTVFFIGDHDSEGKMSQGIWVGLEEVIWTYKDGTISNTMSCKIQQNTPITLDFVMTPSLYSGTGSGEVKIFVNGVLNAAREIKDSFNWSSQSKLYLACKNVNGIIQDFSDVEFYEIKLFRRALNDKQIVINALNSKARSTLNLNGEVDFNVYNQEKIKNFFGAIGSNTSTLLWDDVENTYGKLSFGDLRNNQALPIPVILIDCTRSTGGESNGFTKNVYEAIGTNTTIYNGCTMTYFDPNARDKEGKVHAEVSTENVSIYLQGTSSMNYRSKNLEIVLNKTLYDENGEEIGPELFQPISSWMPENQFTLKADVVDSSHANNASIGKWINANADTLFDKTPPMLELESHRPVDTYTREKHNNVTIKHTLEGFPVALVIHFKGESRQELLGIYSFNLGRGAYYNMGMKFFKEFTTTTKYIDGTFVEETVPSFVKSYKTYSPTERYGSILPSQIYSYEFGENANTIVQGNDVLPLALFMQDDMTVIQQVGEFKYNGATQDDTPVTDTNIWERLQYLFTVLAQMTETDTTKYKFDPISKGYIATEDKYPAQMSFSTLGNELGYRLSIKNAYSYFMICIAFGLVDSLGKNMVLRSWNVGGTATDYENYNKWWPCFYDMDTANGLTNTGQETVAKTAYIDTFENKIIGEAGVNAMQINKNDPNGAYDTYSSRLWDVLRSTPFLQGTNYGLTYETVWNTWRSKSILNSADVFINDFFSSQTRGCGQLLYNYDYKIKYLTKYVKQDDTVASYANVEFLHGTRADYVRDWLKKRFTFFDGVFQYNNNDVPLPYNTIGQIKCGGSEESNPKCIVRLNSPAILKFNIGNKSEARYFVKENTDTLIILPVLSSFETQISMNNTSEISKIEGLKDMRFQGFMDIKLPSMSELDLQNTNTLSENPVLFDSVFVKSINGELNSDIRHINLSNTSFFEGIEESKRVFPVVIKDYKKLKTLDISNGCVTSIALPSASLSELKIFNSAVEDIRLENQAFIDNVDFTGCTRLNTVYVSNCHKITSLNLKNMPNLTTVQIIGCSSLESIDVSGCTKLTQISISDANALTTVNLSRCNNPELSIDLTGATNLTNLNMSDTTTVNVVKLPSNFNSLTNLNISSSNITSLQYGAQPVATYNGEPMLDLSPFKFTTSTLNIQNNTLKYIKLLNGKNNALQVNSNTFEGCVNLTRVFGHINMISSGVFNGNTKFSIHAYENNTPFVEGQIAWYGADTDTEEGLAEWNNNTNLGTNITITTTTLDQSFRSTNCNLYDVYYILSKCQNITNLYYTFGQCPNVITDMSNPLKRDAFKYCGNVTNTSYLFYGTRIAGPLYSPSHDGNNVTAYDGLLSPLKKVTNPNAMFLTSGTKYIDDMFFSKCSNTEYLQFNNLNSFFSDSANDNVVIVSNTNGLTSSNLSSRRSAARASKLLVNLPNLTQLSLAMNNISVNFDTVTYSNDKGSVSYCPLIAHNTKLTYMNRSFENISATGSLAYVFGGHDLFDSVLNKDDSIKKLFPRNIQYMRSFLVVTSALNDSPVYFPIHNKMFDRISGTLYDINANNASSPTWGTVSFSGAGINKQFKAENEGEQFPYEVFSKCIKLQKCPFFFYNMQFSVTPEDVQLPGDIFKNCNSLIDIQSCFRNIGANDFKYTLTSKGFINCKLQNVNNIFNETSGTAKTDKIPYGLFYQEKTTSTSFDAGWTEDEANELGMYDEDFGVLEGEEVDPSINLQAPTKRIEVLKSINNTITSMQYALAGFRSQDATCYKRDDVDIEDIVSIETALDNNWIIYNSNYNPIKFVPNPLYDPNRLINNPAYDEVTNPDVDEFITNPNYNPRRVKLNSKWNKYKYIWNEWYYDGVNGFDEIIKQTLFYSKVQDGSITEIEKDLPASFSNEDDTKKCQDETKPVRHTSMNYICPPDLFRYCTTSANVAYCLSNSSVYTWEPGNQYRENYGIYGRISPILFKPLTAVTTLSHVFYNCHNVTPYTWNTPEEYGKIVHPDLLANNRSLTDVSGLFRGIYIPENIIIPDTLFNKNTSLKNVSWLFGGCIFEGPSDGVQQLATSTFNNNKLIENVSYMIAGGDSVSSQSVSVNNGPRKIGQMFTNTHKNITNVSGFLLKQSNTTGELPAFWTWLTRLSPSNYSNVFYGVRKSNFTNGNDVPDGWNAGMI